MELIIVNAGIVATLLFVYTTGVFFLAQLLRDNSIMDIAYGPAFFISMLGASILTFNINFLPAVVTSCIALWATRLSIRIGRKNIGSPEDARYAKWRQQWLQSGQLYFLLRSYLQINLLQGVIILLVLTPGIIALSYPGSLSISFFSVGLAVYLFGLVYESVADWQLDHFLASKKAGTELDTIMKKGLFKYSRRPNYFGETLIWWGLAIMTLPLPFGFLGLISPLLITFIVTKVTGPMLEDAFMERYPAEYGAYRQTTNYFIPNFLSKKKQLP